MVKIHEKFIFDRKGKRKAVILPYRKYQNLLEDLDDLAVLAERRNDKLTAHKDFVTGIKKDGLL